MRRRTTVNLLGNAPRTCALEMHCVLAALSWSVVSENKWDPLLCRCGLSALLSEHEALPEAGAQLPVASLLLRVFRQARDSVKVGQNLANLDLLVMMDFKRLSRSRHHPPWPTHLHFQWWIRPWHFLVRVTLQREASILAFFLAVAVTHVYWWILN